MYNSAGAHFFRPLILHNHGQMRTTFNQRNETKLSVTKTGVLKRHHRNADDTAKHWRHRIQHHNVVMTTES